MQVHIRNTSFSFFLLAVFLSAPLPVRAQYQSVIDAWVTQDARNPPAKDSVLFIGSSTIRGWESLTQDFADYNVIQRGFGGASNGNLIQYIDDVIIPYDPAAIVMYTRSLETNDERALQERIRFFDLVHSTQRQDRDPIPIMVIGRYPRLDTFNSRWLEGQRRNLMIEEYAAEHDSIHFVDTATLLLDTASETDQPPAGNLFATDGHHLNAEGYELWHQPIREVLETVISPNKRHRLNPNRPAEGERILVDFGGVRVTPSPDMNGNHWNNWHADTGNTIFAGQSLGNLVTTASRKTGVDLVITGEFELSNSGLRRPTNELLGDLAVETATQDQFVPGSVPASRGIPNASFMLTGLDPNESYDLSFFATLRSNRERIARYSVVGSAEPLVKELLLSTSENGQNIDTSLDFTAIQPDEFGQLFVDLQAVDGQYFGYVGIMDLSVTHVPEPSGTILVMLGICGVTYYRIHQIRLGSKRRDHRIRTNNDDIAWDADVPTNRKKTR